MYVDVAMSIRTYAVYGIFALLLGHHIMTSWMVSTFNISPFDWLSTVAAPSLDEDWLLRNQLEMITKAKNKSTVEYSACCGLGHRLSKMVDAYHIARKKNFGMRVIWEFCGDGTESFHHFFGPQPLSELEGVQDGREVIKVMNEAPCVESLVRTGNSTECRCPPDYIESNSVFFNGLVERFRFKDEVDTFRRNHHFDDHFVLGMHVRAGNGEVGDFTRKDRAMHNVSSWVDSVTAMLLTLSRNATSGRPPLLFLATDTASMADTLRDALSGQMDVVVYEQERLPEGSGVLFGEHGSRDKLNVTSELCQDLKNALMDMMVLTSSNVVISGNPSSFTQSLPMGVALSRDHTLYCEVAPNGTYRCYQTFQEWCCLGETFLRIEFINVPRKSDCEIDSEFLVERPESETERLPSLGNSPPMTTFVPYDWDHLDWNHSSG